MQTTILPFKLERTNDLITSQAGLALLGEFMIGLDLVKWFDQGLPGPGSGAGYRPSAYILPLLLMLNGGGRTLEDLRRIHEDQALREVLVLREMPSSDATGDWLRRSGGNGALDGLGGTNRQVLASGLKHDGRDGYTLDMDVLLIEAEKAAARMTYKGFQGYGAMVGHLAENGLVTGDEFREGNEPPASRNLEFL